MALTGHSSAQVNVMHYQSADPDRMRALIRAMSGFKGLRLVRDSAWLCYRRSHHCATRRVTSVFARQTLRWGKRSNARRLVNPCKQSVYERSGRDSNPRCSYPHTAFPVRSLKPLGHRSTWPASTSISEAVPPGNKAGTALRYAGGTAGGVDAPSPVG